MDMQPMPPDREAATTRIAELVDELNALCERRRMGMLVISLDRDDDYVFSAQHGPETTPFVRCVVGLANHLHQAVAGDEADDHDDEEAP